MMVFGLCRPYRRYSQVDDSLGNTRVYLNICAQLYFAEERTAVSDKKFVFIIDLDDLIFK